MWQIQIYNHETKRWENFGRASLDFYALNRTCASLQEAGHRARLLHTTEPEVIIGEVDNE